MPARRGAAIALALGLTLSVAAHAAPEPSAADKAAARELVVTGRQQLADGDARAAIESFAKAHAIMGVPSTGYDLATAQKAAGLWVEAYDTARTVTLIPVGPREPAAFPWARNQAAALIDELGPKIPKLRIAVKGAGERAFEVTVDGVPVASEALAAPRIVNPGEHEVVVRVVEADHDHGEAKQTVSVAEAETREVVLELPEPPAAVDEPASSSPPPPTTGGPDPEQADEGVPVWAWVAGGAGLVALGVAVGFAVDYSAAQSTIDEDCAATNSKGEPVCDPARYSLDDAESLYGRRNTSAGVAIGLGVVGLVGIGVGIAGIVSGLTSEPSDPASGAQSAHATWTPWLAAGPGSAALGARGTW